MSEGSDIAGASDAPAAPVFVVVEGVSAGVAVREGSSLRFRAIHPRFEILDGSRFTRAEQLRHAALRVAKASRD